MRVLYTGLLCQSCGGRNVHKIWKHHQRILSAPALLHRVHAIVLPAAGVRGAELCAGETRAELLHAAELRTAELRATSLCAAKL